jgi:4-amino-4-deoxy-L-arabinose transferase-like glycosyltransferase
MQAETVRRSKQGSPDLGELRLILLARWPLVVLGAIVLLAGVVRVIDLAGTPPGFFADEASFGVNAWLVLTTGKDEHGQFLPILFESFGEYKLPVFAYAEMPFMVILGRTELAVRLTAAVIGALTIVTTYLLGKELFRRELPALSSAVLLAILPWHIHYSRTGMEIITCPLFVTAGLYLFFRALRQGSSMLPAAVVLGLSFYAYRAAWVVLPPVVLVLCLLYYKELLRDRRDVLFSAGLLLLILLPLLRHLLSDNGDRSSQAWIFNLETEQSTLSLFWEFYKSYFSFDFLFRLGDNGPITRHYLPGHGVLYWFLLPLVLAGVARALLAAERRYVVLPALLLFFPLSGALSDTSPISSRAILGTVTFALLAGLGLGTLVDLTARLRPRATLLAVTVTLVVFATLGAMSFASYTSAYFNDYPRLSAGYWGWQDGPQEIISRFLAVQDEYDALYMDGMFNAPHIFFPFYAGDRCEKCSVGGPDRFEPGRRQMFAVRAENRDLARYEFRLRDTLFYPDGSPSFFLVEITGRR